MAKKAYIGVEAFDPVFANNTWAQIIKACQMNEVPATWKVKDQKAMSIGGTSYMIDIIGKNHDVFSDGSGTSPLTFQLHDCYKTVYSMNATSTNEGGYDSSMIHTTYLPTIKALMPTEVQAAIKPVNKSSSEGSKSTKVETISCDLFLLSVVEVFGKNNISASGEGSQYAYYTDGGSKLKYRANAAAHWWLRSPHVGSSTAFGVVFNDGTLTAGGAQGSYGISFAFCFGGTSELNNDVGCEGVAGRVNKAYIGIAEESYKIVDGIESTGTQYLDTGFVCNNKSNYKVIMDFTLKSSGTLSVCGTQVVNSQRTLLAYYTGGILYFTGGALSAPSSACKARLTAGNRYKIEFTTNTLAKTVSAIVNGTELVSQTYTGALDETTPVYIGAFHHGDVYKFVGLIHSYQLEQDGVLVRDYVSCINSSGKVGMLDLVSMKFYGSKGTGVFVAGEETGETISVNVVSRQIKLAYIGDENGIARLWYSRNSYFVPTDASRFITADNETFCIRGDET